MAYGDAGEEVTIDDEFQAEIGAKQANWGPFPDPGDGSTHPLFGNDGDGSVDDIIIEIKETPEYNISNGVTYPINDYLDSLDGNYGLDGFLNSGGIYCDVKLVIRSAGNPGPGDDTGDLIDPGPNSASVEDILKGVGSFQVPNSEWFTAARQGAFFALRVFVRHFKYSKECYSEPAFPTTRCDEETSNQATLLQAQTVDSTGLNFIPIGDGGSDVSRNVPDNNFSFANIAPIPEQNVTLISQLNAVPGRTPISVGSSTNTLVDAYLIRLFATLASTPITVVFSTAEPPVISSSSATPATLDGTESPVWRSDLAVTATDADDGEPALTYTWALTGGTGPSTPTILGPNGTNDAKDSIVIFFDVGQRDPGTYEFTVTATDPGGLTDTDTVTITI